MIEPVEIELYSGGRLLETCIAREEAELNCRIEMMTGIGWLDAEPLYQSLQSNGRAEVRDTFRVCNSYEKWGAWQQEVVKIEVRMRRLPKAKPSLASLSKKIGACLRGK